MKKFNFLTLLSISLSFSLFVSCTSNLPENDNAYFSAVMDEAFSTSVSETAITEASTSINSYIDSISLLGVGALKVGAVNPTVSKVAQSVSKYPIITLLSEKGVYPREYVIDYGKEGYVNKNKTTYRGQIFYTVSDKASKKRVYKFSEFYINKDKVEGGRTVEVLESRALHIVSDENITPAIGKPYYRHSERTRTRVDTEGVEYFDDQKNELYSYSFEISKKGTDVNGKEYSMKTEKPLVTIPNWKYFVSGTVVISTSKGTQYLDFGSGDKDNIVVRTINDKSEKIFLKW